MENFFVAMHSILSTPFLFKVLLLVPIAVLGPYLSVKVKRKALMLFFPLAIILMLREIVFHFIRIDTLYFVTDVFICLTYFQLLRSYTGRQSHDKTLWIVNIIYAVLIILNRVFGWLPAVYGWFSNLWTLGLFIYVYFKFWEVSRYNTIGAELLLAYRKKLPQLTFFPYLFLLPLQYESYNPFVHYIFIPLTYLPMYFLLSQYWFAYEHDLKQQIKNLDYNFESIFDFLKKISSAISDRVEISQVLEYIVESAVKDTGADGGVVLMVDEVDEVLKVKAYYGSFPPPYPVKDKVKSKIEALRENFKSAPIRFGKTILGEAAQTAKPIYIRDTGEDERMVQNTKNDALFMNSVIVMPLVDNNKVLGVLAIASCQDNKYFSQDHFDHIRAFADYASLTINNLYIYMQLLEKQEMEREVRIAADIQQDLLPKKLPQFRSFQISAFSAAAKGVSGDYYDIIPLKRNGKIALVICDVAGKGVPASLVMVMIRTIIYLIAGANKDPQTIVSLINRGIVGQVAADRFATLSFMTYDPQTRILEYSNAAHHPLMLYRAKNARVETLDTDGIPIGLEKTTRYNQVRTRLFCGDIICLYTDGIIEAMNSRNEQYSYERLIQMLKDNSKEGPKVISAAILEDINKFVGKASQHDDQTLLLLKAR